MFKVNYKDARTSASIVNFEQVITVWLRIKNSSFMQLEMSSFKEEQTSFAFSPKVKVQKIFSSVGHIMDRTYDVITFI